MSEDRYCDTSKLYVKEVTKFMAKKMVVKYHYSHLWTKCSVALGLFHDTGKQHSFFSGNTEELIGVCVYGDPIGRYSGGSISESLDRKQVLELTRLYVHDGYGSNIESWFISQTFKWLKKNFSSIEALISYADPKEGHAGTIYQATNWLYQGNSIRPNDTYSFKLKPDDEWIHGRTLANTYRTNDIEKLKKKIGHTFWYRVEPLKHRYVYLLKNKRKLMKHLKHPIKPYPKVSDVDDLKITKVVV